MFRRRQEHQILNPIVEFVAIYMVNNLIRYERTTEMRLHNDTMLKPSSFRSPDHGITSNCYVAPTTPMRRLWPDHRLLMTCSATVADWSLTISPRMAIKRSAAVLASPQRRAALPMRRAFAGAILGRARSRTVNAAPLPSRARRAMEEHAAIMTDAFNARGILARHRDQSSRCRAGSVHSTARLFRVYKPKYTAFTPGTAPPFDIVPVRRGTRIPAKAAA